MKTKLFAYSKFNLFLNILDYSPKVKKHKISSVFVLSKQFFDIIEITELDNESGLKISYIDQNKQKLDIQNCIIKKTLTFLEKRYGKKINAKILVKKQIPYGSGLGGGSSDASQIIQWFYKRFKINLKNQVPYKEIAIELGSDIPFFLSNSNCAYVSGFGDRILPLDQFKIKHRIIINGIKCDTKKIFEKYLTLKKADFSYQNDLMPVAFKLYPELKQEYLKLKKKYGPLLMSGSGSSFVVLNPGEDKND